MAGPKGVQNNCGCPTATLVQATTPDDRNYGQVLTDLQKGLACTEQCAYRSIPKEKVDRLLSAEKKTAQQFVRFIGNLAQIYSEYVASNPEVRAYKEPIATYRLLAKSRYESD